MLVLPVGKVIRRKREKDASLLSDLREAKFRAK